MKAANSPRKFSLLIYDVRWGRQLLRPNENDDRYELTCDLARLPHADVVLIHVPTAPDLARVRKFPGQVRVAFSLESDVNYPQLQDPQYLAQFDLTMTYRWDSDVPLMYWWPELRRGILEPSAPKTEPAPAAAFFSNSADKSGRLDYLRRMMRYIPVDGYGRALHTRDLPMDKGRESKLQTLRRYHFDLAFENSIARDYVTEKFYDSLVAGCVPVYRGAPNIEDFAPADHCYINAADFHGPRELAEYLLHLAKNPAEYNAYFAWKGRPLRDGFLQKISVAERDPFRRLCELLTARGFTPRHALSWRERLWPRRSGPGP